MADNSDALPSAMSRTPVVGIGASAGGITALQKFFDVLDDNLGAAFVVVVHLDPRHSSELPAILQNHTRMSVLQVNEPTRLEPNPVYVIPPDRRLLITGESVAAAPFSEPRGRRAPIALSPSITGMDMPSFSVAAARTAPLACVTYRRRAESFSCRTQTTPNSHRCRETRSTPAPISCFQSPIWREPRIFPVASAPR